MEQEANYTVAVVLAQANGNNNKNKIQLYSPLCGYVDDWTITRLKTNFRDSAISVKVKGKEYLFDKNGFLIHYDVDYPDIQKTVLHTDSVEMMLFPSKEERTWNNLYELTDLYNCDDSNKTYFFGTDNTVEINEYLHKNGYYYNVFTEYKSDCIYYIRNGRLKEASNYSVAYNIITNSDCWKEVKLSSHFPTSWEEYISQQGDEEQETIKVLISHDKMYTYDKLSKLLLLRDVYNGDWKPDWFDDSIKYVVKPYSYDFDKGIIGLTVDPVSDMEYKRLFYFDSEETAATFINNFSEELRDEDIIEYV